MIYKFYDRKNPKVFYYCFKEEPLNDQNDCLNNNFSDKIFGKTNEYISNVFIEKQCSLLADEMMKKKFKNEENNSLYNITNDNSNNEEIINNIENFIDMVNKFDDNLFIYKPKEGYNKNEKINEIVQNKENGKLVL